MKGYKNKTRYQLISMPFKNRINKILIIAKYYLICIDEFINSRHLIIETD